MKGCRDFAKITISRELIPVHGEDPKFLPYAFQLQFSFKTLLDQRIGVEVLENE